MLVLQGLRLIFFTYTAVIAILALLPVYLLSQDVAFVDYLIQRATSWLNHSKASTAQA